MAQVAIAGTMRSHAGARHRAIADEAIDPVGLELRRVRRAVVDAGGGVPDDGLTPRPVDEEEEAVAAAEEAPPLVGSPDIEEARGEVAGAAAAGGIDDAGEAERAVGLGEESEQGRVRAPGAEAAEEGGVGGDAAPAAADVRGAVERGVARREAEEDLGEEVVVFQR